NEKEKTGNDRRRDEGARAGPTAVRDDHQKSGRVEPGDGIQPQQHGGPDRPRGESRPLEEMLLWRLPAQSGGKWGKFPCGSRGGGCQSCKNVSIGVQLDAQLQKYIEHYKPSC